MIAIDTSALVAILLNEPEANLFAQIIAQDDSPVISAATFIEICRVMKFKQGEQTKRNIERLIQAASISIVSVTPQQADIACEATYQYPVLNYGDTFSYALAKERNIPLLFKGHDFSQTDIEAAA